VRGCDGLNRDIHRSSTAADRAATRPASNQEEGMRVRASCALCFNLGKVLSSLSLAGFCVSISRISAGSAESNEVEGAKSLIQLHGKERHLIDEARWRGRCDCDSLGRGFFQTTTHPRSSHLDRPRASIAQTSISRHQRQVINML
jgi:hypothetical protein